MWLKSVSISQTDIFGTSPFKLALENSNSLLIVRDCIVNLARQEKSAVHQAAQNENLFNLLAYVQAYSCKYGYLECVVLAIRQLVSLFLNLEVEWIMVVNWDKISKLLVSLPIDTLTESLKEIPMAKGLQDLVQISIRLINDVSVRINEKESGDDSLDMLICTSQFMTIIKYLDTSETAEIILRQSYFLCALQKLCNFRHFRYNQTSFPARRYTLTQASVSCMLLLAHCFQKHDKSGNLLHTFNGLALVNSSIETEDEDLELRISTVFDLMIACKGFLRQSGTQDVIFVSVMSLLRSVPLYYDVRLIGQSLLGPVLVRKMCVMLQILQTHVRPIIR